MHMSIWVDNIPLTKNPARFMWAISRPHWRPALVAMLAVIVSATLYAVIPYVFKLIADSAAALAQGGAYRDLILAAFAYIGVALLAGLIWRVSGFAGALWATGARASARYALTAYVTRHSRSYFSDHFAGSLANKINHAAAGSADVVEEVLWQFLNFFVTIIASFVIAFLASPTIALILMAWVAIVAPLNVYFARKRVPLSAATQNIEAKLSGATVDLLSNITAMQEYARRAFEIDRLKIGILKRRAAGLRNWRFGEAVLLGNGLLQTFFSGAMVLVAVYLTQAGTISVGDIVLIIALVFNIEERILFLGSNLNSFSETWGEIRESLEEILEPHQIVDKPGARPLEAVRGQLMFDNISFGYLTPPLFRGLTLHIPAGQKVGLVGKSGSGKSTLTRLLLRHHELTGGAILIDGQNIAEATVDSVRKAIAVVPQEPVLFHRTIRENILYGRLDATDEEVERAARLANAHGFIEKLPKGYDTLVGERGVKLSGGERQRIVIARAILKNAPILLLDEATSALDSESEVAIQDALRMLMEGKTVIAIAHRLSTLHEMDRIVVLHDGEIVEDGTHDALIAEGGTYADLWRHQAGGFLQEEDEDI
ncbi:ABC transporter permease [Candidatus Kaiserbacteria bacterium CG10_big_fil_rev_8_21_14_0_10_59_10]|uniref:ABC transporter permease n=1 Tax=Candidatus Kaiserbacteria bacterium CG10_big_fil_rev_8_21_14_0_10_59_10 TaxID=1974612 RepID=A0A2H0U7V3_9BACT|nr:MAG: ABC transporter permease [Candidatus Kaiserbacteria bacterium CG10_big_fil_rev_8_21_14_0_10_59_10]